MLGLGATDPADLQAHACAQLPDIPFEKRIQQLQAFKADTGTLDIDHNYKHCSNLGGWAVEITAQYAGWKSRATQPSQDNIATSPRSGSQCCYRIHPEEVFLFTMTKVATGLSNQRIVDMYIGSDYACWLSPTRG